MSSAEKKEQAAAVAAAAPPLAKKGFALKLSAGPVKVSMAPPALRTVTKGPEDLEMRAAPPKPSVAARSMFGGPAKAAPPTKPKPAAAAPIKPKPAAAAAAAAAAPPPPEGEGDGGLADLLAAQEGGPAEAPAAEAAVDNLSLGSDTLEGLSGELREMADLIVESEQKNLYNSDVPEAYIPETRRGFSEFIKMTYKTFELPDGAIEIPEGERYYPYQKFVRDYMRKESPYRGILVYHGLGSGKTCTAIATAEALFASSKKKIIVMAPKSLKRNFFKEVTFCGFRHFQLNNYWIPIPISDPTTTIFANQVLGLPGSYLKTVRNVWVPDFRRPQSEQNYFQPKEGEPPRPGVRFLTDEEREEVRKQIQAIVEWDPVKNPSGRIRFVAYNGITAKKLKEWACDPSPNKFFDNAVIVVDEIHNLVRLIEGTIEPYMSAAPGKTEAEAEEAKEGAGKKKGKKKRTVAVEPVTPFPYKPTLCSRPNKLYARGYLMYRLLLDARNSKIVGLSGTPLINFPEEIGILANLLHGYITIGEGLIEAVGADTQRKCIDIGLANPYIDFVEAMPSTAQGSAGMRVLFSLLQPGLRKIGHTEGVERIPAEEPQPTLEQIVEAIKDSYKQAGLVFKDNTINLRSEHILPGFKDEFVEKFIQSPESGALKNEIVLLKRLTGLVSYYKGSRLELMPRVKSDEIVRVPFSILAQRKYSVRRGQEIDREREDEGMVNEMDGVWAQVFELNDNEGANNYKMGSRQSCNFAFPEGLVRPTSNNKTVLLDEAVEGGALVPLTTAPGEEQGAPGEQEDEMPALGEGEEEEEEAEVAAAAAEDKRINAELEGEEGDEGGEGGEGEEGGAEATETTAMGGGGSNNEGEGGLAGAAKAVVKTVMKATVGEEKGKPAAGAGAVAPAVPKTKTLAEKRAELAAKKAAGAAAPAAAPLAAAEVAAAAEKAADEPDPKRSAKAQKEAYDRARIAAKKALATTMSDRLRLGVPNGLEVHSPKYAAMLQRINEAPGSSLVYSQFLDMEGIGIFRIAMDVNGFAPIEIVPSGGTFAFSKETEKSFRERPEQPRYITFSGGEAAEIRGVALDLFNAKLDDLPEPIAKVLGGRFTDNHRGQICRVFCITSAGAEGLSLKCVRAVHIMEPYWNEVRLRQVKGRAIRIGSHLELPEDQRDVSIYTYLSVFSEEAQRGSSADYKIDENVLSFDAIPVAEAQKLGLPVKPGYLQYVLTADEMIYLVLEKKKKIVENIERILKSAAIDCELNYKQNKDETFQCLPLRGAVGDFLYHPILTQDITMSKGLKFKGLGGDETAAAAEAPKREKKDIIRNIRAAEAAGNVGEVGRLQAEMAKLEPAGAAAAAAPPAKPAAAPAKPAPEKPKGVLKKYRDGKIYRMVEVTGPDGSITGFEMLDKDTGELKARAAAKGGKPAEPVTFI